MANVIEAIRRDRDAEIASLIRTRIDEHLKYIQQSDDANAALRVDGLREALAYVDPNPQR